MAKWVGSQISGWNPKPQLNNNSPARVVLCVKIASLFAGSVKETEKNAQLLLRTICGAGEPEADEVGCGCGVK
jgi:hypothetical protein